MGTFRILARGGDGIGPEVVASGLRLVDAIAGSENFKFDINEDRLHGAAWDRYGTFCRDETVAAARAAGAVLVGAVLDAELRVRGTQGLRVVDASSFPDQISGNTNAPVIMMAEKAADMIFGRPPLPPEEPGKGLS